MNKQQLANKIWASANKMRSKIEANEYKDYILGFIFYKYLSEKQENFLKAEGYQTSDVKQLSEDKTQEVDYIKNNIGYFMAYNNLFSTWLNKGSDFNVSNVSDALSAFSRNISINHKKVFDGIFKTLETGLSKLGDTSGARTKAISGLLDLIKDIPMNGKQDYDVLGFIYEYLISQFAANAGKKAGEFYTPHEISVLMSDIIADHLKDKQEIQIYDPTSGSGSLLINIGQSVAKHMADKDKIKYYAQELKGNTYNLTRMNLIMRGILPDNIITRNADTLEDDWPYFDDNDPTSTYNLLSVNAVVSNPPYSQNWEPKDKDNDPRYSGFGLAPKTKADYAFLLHDLYHLKHDGIMTIVLPHGVLFRGGSEGEIRKNLIEKDHIEAVIGLPANIFFGTGIPTIILVLKRTRATSDVLFVDASKGFVKVGKNNQLRASDIKKIVDTVINKENTDKYSRLVAKEEIKQNEYNLNIPRYIDSSEPSESFDIYATMFGGIPQHEVDELNSYWQAFPTLQSDLFTKEENGYNKVKNEDIKQTLNDNEDVQSFISSFKNSFADFSEFLKQELLTDIADINISNKKIVLTQDIFSRLQDLPLIDKYHAYQFLDDNWQQIKTDFEIIQTEGFEATKIVDANMVTKNKDGKEIEVQDGWIGRIIPFEVVQNYILKDEADALKDKENRLLEITSEFDAILSELSEEDKEAETVNEDKTSFINKEVVKEAKRIKAEIKQGEVFDADSYEQNILQVDKLITKEKALKKQVKDETTALILKTKATIENLSDERALELLEKKWIMPLIADLYALPINVVNDLTYRVKILAEKYATTLVDVEEDIASTSTTICSMIDDLVGNDFDMQGLAEFKKLLGGYDE